MSYGFAFLLILVPLVVFHEFGHFIVAKLAGINVTQFAFGFGKKLASFHYKGTEYRWNLLPLGGYVDFMGEVSFSGEIPDDANHFYNKPKWVRFLVLVMGPVFNLILAFGIYWLVNALTPSFHLTYSGEPYTVGFVAQDSPEAKAGLQTGDRIIALDGKPVDDVGNFDMEIFMSPGKEVTYTVKRGDETLEMQYRVPEHEVEGYGLKAFDHAYRVSIREVMAGSPADQAGLKMGDRITHVNGEPILYYVFEDRETTLMRRINGISEFPITFTIERDDKSFDVPITPLKSEEDGRYQIGILHGPEFVLTENTITGAFFLAWDNFKEGSTLIYKGLHKLVVGDLPLKTLSGPLDVSRHAKRQLDMGILAFLALMALLSLNLGLLNLLPIPILDGGEIFVLGVEWISRRDFNLMTKMRIKLVGFVFLIGLMGVVMISDVLKFLS